VKILEVDKARKRIALSIKQTQEAVERKSPNNNNLGRRDSGLGARIEGVRNKYEGAVKKEQDLSSLSVDDALSLLKKKFGK